MMLLLTAWRSPDCALPDDDNELRKIAKCDSDTWMRIRDKLLSDPYFVLQSDGRFRQKRLYGEWRYASRLHRQQSKGGKKGRETQLKKNSENKGSEKDNKNNAVTSLPPAVLGDSLGISDIRDQTPESEPYRESAVNTKESLFDTDKTTVHDKTKPIKNVPMSDAIKSLQIPTKNGSMYQVSAELIREMESLYEHVDVREELADLITWCYKWPERRKVRIRSFVNKWMSKADRHAMTGNNRGKNTLASTHKPNRKRQSTIDVTGAAVSELLTEQNDGV